MNPRLCACLAVMLALLAAPAPTGAQARGTLIVTVEGVIPPGGVLRMGVYDRAGYDTDKETAFADVPAKIGTTVVTLTGIPPGEYGVMVYQDLNSNDKVDSNFLGIPREPYGFSRNARPFLSRPGFDDVKLTITAGENRHTLRLQNTGQD